MGLYLISATDFIAQENTFTNYGTITSPSALLQEYNYGMVVNNCTGSTPVSGAGAGLGYAYKNIFSNLNVNLQSELDNLGNFNPAVPVPSSGGLEFKCNEFNTRINFDVTVPDGPGGIASLIRNQGLCAALDPQTQAGNNYTACTAGSSEQLDFGPSYSLGANGGFAYRDQPGIYSCTNLTSSIVPCPGSIGSSSCPSNFSLCATIPCLTTEYTDALFAAKQILDSYKQLLDGGNTSFLLGAINSSMSTGSLKNILMSKSPYLSDEVLIATLNRQDLPPYGHLEQIFIANSPITQSVISVFENTGLPSGILNNIMAAQTGISARTEKENEVDYYTFQAILAGIKLKQEYLKIEDKDSLKVLAGKDTSLAGVFKLLEFLITEGSYTDAENCLIHIHSKEQGIHSDRCRLNEIRLDLAKNNKSWFDMNASQYATILQIYQNNTETAIEARSILALTKDLKYARYPFDVQIVRSMYTSNPETIEAADVLSGFKVYPNPGTDYTKVEISLNDGTLQAELIVYNILGSEISKQIVSNKDVLTINTNDFNNGIYLFILKTEQKIIEKQKVIVSK